MMALYLLNLSVDPPNPHPTHIPEDLSINKQESIIEIVVEKILGYENAIKEYDDHDTENNNKKKNVKIDLTTRYIVDYNFKRSPVETTRQKFPVFNAYLTNGFYQPDSPPPKI